MLDTKKENELIILICKFHPEAENLLTTCHSAEAKVDNLLRSQTAGNHSATHLLHSALKETLGSHIAQKGSLVAPNQLRFDFSHFSKITDEEMKKIEGRVNQKIRENISLKELRNIPIAEAQKMGATALFGDKYGDFVRVIIFDPAYSMELCGGTHVSQTGEIGWFKLVSESSVAAGVRRIEALTGSGAQKYIDEQLSAIESVSSLLNNPTDIPKAVSALILERDLLAKKVEKADLERKNELKKELMANSKSEGGISKLVAKVSVGSPEILRQLCFEIREEIAPLFMVLAADIEGKPQLAVMLSEDLISSKNLNASQIARELGKEIKGGGGGQPFFATAGGQDISGLDRVLEKANAIL